MYWTGLFCGIPYTIYSYFWGDPGLVGREREVEIEICDTEKKRDTQQSRAQISIIVKNNKKIKRRRGGGEKREI
jgi:hypothetical protein